MELELKKVLNLKHPLIRMRRRIGWKKLGKLFNYSGEKIEGVRLTEIIIRLHYLKHSFIRNDSVIINIWLENPYWQFFTGMTTFQKELPFDKLGMTSFRLYLSRGKLFRKWVESLQNLPKLPLPYVVEANWLELSPLTKDPAFR